MELWVATIGWYEDERLVGIGRTEVDAEELIARLRESGRGSGLEHTIYGPMTLGEAYDWQLNKI